MTVECCVAPLLVIGLVALAHARALHRLPAGRMAVGHGVDRSARLPAARRQAWPRPASSRDMPTPSVRARKSSARPAIRLSSPWSTAVRRRQRPGGGDRAGVRVRGDLLDGVSAGAPRRRRASRASSPPRSTALYSPLPYFGSLILTELWTAFVATAAILICLRAAQNGRLRDYAIAGALFSATTMVRPAFVLMPFFFAIAVPMLVRSQRTPARAARTGPCSRSRRRSR